MGLFNRKKKGSPEYFGKLLGEVLRESLASQFNKQNLVTTQEQFIERGWEFNYARYSFEIMSLYVNMIQLRIVKEYANCSDPTILASSFIESLPIEYVKQSNKQFLESLNSILKSDKPLVTISRKAAENYFGDKAGMEEFLHFVAFAKAFDYVLNTFSDEVDLN